MQFVVGYLHVPGSDSKPFLQKGHGGGTGCRGSRDTCVGVTVTGLTAGAVLAGTGCGWKGDGAQRLNPALKHNPNTTRNPKGKFAHVPP